MDEDLEPMQERIYIAKMRPCLKCREPFESEWSGERVCKRCKSGIRWREGSDFESEWRVASRRR